MNNTIRRVGVITKPQQPQPETMETVCRLLAWVAERNLTLHAIDENIRAQTESHACGALEICSPDELAASVDLLVVLGGDGTMIGAARLLGDREIPVLGVNYGRLGYLAEYRTDELTDALEAAFAGEYRSETRVMLKARLIRGDDVIADGRVLNDIVISKSLARIVEIEAWYNSQFVASFRADGLIISTPTGSTAYNLSAGGPVVYPSMDALVITPICPHTLSNRPLVVPDDGEIEIRLDEETGEVMLTLDGQIGFALEAGDRVFIRKSRTRFNIIQPLNRNYFDALRDKLRWSR